MSRYKRFTFLCNLNERLMIALLADELHRSQSDAVRLVIREAVKKLAIEPEKSQRKDSQEMKYEQL